MDWRSKLVLSGIISAIVASGVSFLDGPRWAAFAVGMICVTIVAVR